VKIVQLLMEWIAPRPQRLAPPAPRAPRAKRAGRSRSASSRPSAGPKKDLYAHLTREMCLAHNVRVRAWRTSMSGVAWCTQCRDGTSQRWIESPRPKSPMSCAVFLHEIGHHAIGIGAYKPRCLEEYHAWMFALAHLEKWGIEITPRVRTRVQRSLTYAVAKAKRRGIRELPKELRAYA
jgi:hypothetical protein